MVCQSCGACCAAFRVDFHPAELEGGNFAWEGGIPLVLTVPVTPHLVRMAGTDASPPRCVALSGEVGSPSPAAGTARRPPPAADSNPLQNWALPDGPSPGARRRTVCRPLENLF